MRPPLLVEFTLPFQDPVLIVALVLLIILVAPLVLQRFRIPGLIGLILAGVVVGPNAANLLDRDPTIILLGTVGLLYLMFLAGLEINLNLFARHRTGSVVFGLLTFALPQGLGTLMAIHLLGFAWPTAILLGSVFASHTLLAYPIASRLGLSKTVYSTTAVGATIVTDIAALLVLAVVASSTEGELNAAFWIRLVLSLATFVFLVFWGLPRVGRWFFLAVRGEGDAEFVFVLAAMLAASFLAEVAGVEAIIGAFLAGLALNRLVPESGPLMNRIVFVGNSLFIPFFLLSVGMLVDLRVLGAGPEAWIVAGAMLVTVLLTKWLAAQATRPLLRYSADEAGMVFGLTIPQAAATLAAVLIGYEIGLFTSTVLNGTIVMILVTCIVGPYATERFGRRLALKMKSEPVDLSDAPQRILVPIANPATVQALMDLAFFLRDPKLREPIFPLTVAREDDAEAGVAAGEKLLSHAVLHAAAADTPVLPITRVDENIHRGIIRAIRERRISTLVIGWNGQPSAQQRIFGGILDQLLDQTRQMVFVCRIEHPLNTTLRVVLAVPPYAERETGFDGAIHAVRVFANQIGAAIHVVVEKHHEAAVEERVTRIKPEVTTTFGTYANWSGLLPALQDAAGDGHLLLLLAAREGTISWRPALNRLPRDLSTRFRDANFITLYPAEVGLRRDDAAGALPEQSLEHGTFTPDHTVHGLDGVPVEEVVDRLLAHAFDDEATRSVVAERVLSNMEYSAEIRPGVLVLHAHLPHVERRLLFVGTSTDGLHADGVSAPVHVIVLLVDPADREAAEHVRALASLARLVRSDDVVERLRSASSPGELRRVLATAPKPA